MSTTLPDLNAVLTQRNGNGVIISYACEYLTTIAADYNHLEKVIVPSYYDLVYDCSQNPVEIRDRIASRILTRAAERWAIEPSGETCNGIGVYVDNNALLAVSSEPADTFIDELSCQNLTPGDGECCLVVESKMTFVPYVPYTLHDLWAFMASELNSGALLTPSDSFQTSYLGSAIEQPKGDGGDLPPLVVGIESGKHPGVSEKQKFSSAGAITFSFMLMALVGVMFILIRWRTRECKAQEISDALSQCGDEPRFQVTVLSDDGREVSGGSHHRNRSSYDTPYTPSPWSYGKDVEKDVHYDADDDFDRKDAERPTYMFDLSDSFRNGVMATYADSPKTPISPFHSTNTSQQPTTIEVVPPYSMEETSDSEADSWAQTDGTVGSLEDTLEEITAEI